MGFFKRFFSLGSRKSKRKNQANSSQVDPTGRIVRAQEPWQQDQEGDVTRLLRSSSAHFAVVKEVDYSTLPPLPHPINSVAHTPLATPTKSVSSMQRRGTYTVKVLERKLESTTEFPNANPPLHDVPPKSKSTPPEIVSRNVEESFSAIRIDPRSVPFTPRDQSRLIRLKQDPSVASLLNMYDDKGRISSAAFSNTPPTALPHGREPIKRSGSTLRQLLGNPDTVESGDTAEGDISWAERFIGEHANGSQCSFASTAPVETPKDFLFTHTPSENTKSVMPNTNITIISDTSQELSADYPVISSMEVEVSGTAADLDLEPETIAVVADATTPKASEPRTPMRASEVFGFLTERRKTVLERQKSLRALETTPLATVSLNPSTDKTARITGNPSPDTSDISITTTSAQIHTATFTKLTPILNPLSPSSDHADIIKAAKPYETASYIPAPSTRVQLTGDSHSSSSTTSSKIPRGPRPLPSAPSTCRTPVGNPSKMSLVSEARSDALKEKERDRNQPPRTPNTPSTRIPVPSADSFTPVRPRQQRRIASHASSVASSDGEGRRATSSHHHKRSRKSERVPSVDKENSPPSLSARAIFDKRNPNVGKGDPPSPASSSELSPVAKEMMMNLRRQRMRTREGMRSSLKRSPRRSP